MLSGAPDGGLTGRLALITDPGVLSYNFGAGAFDYYYAFFYFDGSMFR